MAGCSEHGFGPSGFIFLDQLSKCHLPKNDYATFNLTLYTTYIVL